MPFPSFIANELPRPLHRSLPEHHSQAQERHSLRRFCACQKRHDANLWRGNHLAQIDTDARQQTVWVLIETAQTIYYYVTGTNARLSAAVRGWRF